MKYRIEVQEIKEILNEKYPSKETIYEQTVETEDGGWLVDVIKAVNELQNPE